MHIFIRCFIYVVDFMILEDLGNIIDGRLSEVVMGKTFMQASKLTYDESLGLIRFAHRDDKVVFRMPQRTKELDLVSPLEKDKFEAFFVENLKATHSGAKRRYFRTITDLKTNNAYAIQGRYGGISAYTHPNNHEGNKINYACMTRSSTKELFTPFKKSLDFDLFSDQEEYSEEEVAKTMAKTMEQYMSKTRADYGS
ncbi:hypothetical protein Tco_1218531 [Tanacetum coccineum]